MTIFQPTIALKKFVSGSVSYEDSYLDENKNIAIISSVDSVSQTVSNAISLWKKEYQFNITFGIPWLNILGNPLNKLLLNSYIQGAVLSVNYVSKILSIDYVTDNNNRVTQVTVKYTNTDNTIGVANANI